MMRELVADASVTEANAIQFLGVIEQRINELLQQYGAMQSTQSSMYGAIGVGGMGSGKDD
jgi:hypothetical protein